MKAGKKVYVKPKLQKLDMIEVSATTCCRRNRAIPNCSMINKTGGKSNKYNTAS